MESQEVVTALWDCLGVVFIRSAPVTSMTEIVKLNVGGQVFVTTRSTLKNIEGHMLNAMIRHDNPARMIDGAYFIDRNPRMFEWILDHFRGSGVVPPPGSVEAQKLKEEAIYFNIVGLIEILNHQTAAKFNPKDHMVVNGTKYTVREVTPGGYYVTRQNKKFHIDTHPSMLPTKIEVGDQVVVYARTAWKPGVVTEIDASSVHVLIDGEDLPYVAVTAGVRF